MEGIPLSPSRILKGFKLRIDGFGHEFEILKLKEEGITISSGIELQLLSGSPITGQITSSTLQFRFQGTLQRQVLRPDQKGFILGIQLNQTVQFPDLLIALEFAS
ncbi:hypothetical protein AB3N59_11565 [Leptospira sp. WS92.C1]